MVRGRHVEGEGGEVGCAAGVDCAAAEGFHAGCGGDVGAGVGADGDGEVVIELSPVRD